MDQNKIKILYVITKSTWGGAQRYVFDIAASLDRSKFDIAVAAGEKGQLLDKLEEKGIRTITIPFLRKNVDLIREILSLLALIKIFKQEQPDIIHLNSSKIGGLGAIAARLSSLVTHHPPLIIFTAHGWGFNEDRPYPARLLIFFLQWLTILFCHRVICVSYAVFRQGMYFPFALKKMRLVNLGIKKPEFLDKPKARDLLTRLCKTGSANPEFLWVGAIAELTKNKGLTHLIDAVNQMKTQNPNSKFQCLIVGEGEGRKKLEALITKYKLQNTVFLPGFVPDAARYLKAFDIFALPSITEAAGYVLHEAGLAGLPVVATKVGGIPEIVKDGENGILVPKKDPGALARALEKLLNNEDLRKTMGQKNREIVSQKFSFTRMLQETIEVYNKP